MFVYEEKLLFEARERLIEKKKKPLTFSGTEWEGRWQKVSKSCDAQATFITVTQLNKKKK